jgi:hypothetical protein
MTAMQRQSLDAFALTQSITFRPAQNGREHRRSAPISRRVREQGHFWTVDMVLVDAYRRAAALEWTQFAKNGRVLRGVDWFAFEAGSFRIQEIHAYGAAPIQPDLERQELRDFDYAARGYPMTRPA